MIKVTRQENNQFTLRRYFESETEGQKELYSMRNLPMTDIEDTLVREGIEDEDRVEAIQVLKYTVLPVLFDDDGKVSIVYNREGSA